MFLELFLIAHWELVKKAKEKRVFLSNHCLIYLQLFIGTYNCTVLVCVWGWNENYDEKPFIHSIVGFRNEITTLGYFIHFNFFCLTIKGSSEVFLFTTVENKKIWKKINGIIIQALQTRLKAAKKVFVLKDSQYLTISKQWP